MCAIDAMKQGATNGHQAVLGGIAKGEDRHFADHNELVCADCSSKPISGGSLLAREHPAVDIQGERDGCMTKSLGNHMRSNAGLRKDRGVRMAAVMEPQTIESQRVSHGPELC